MVDSLRLYNLNLLGFIALSITHWNLTNSMSDISRY
jgi:hypothetical protein